MAVVDGITTGATVILKKLSFIVVNEITLVWDFKDELKNLQSTLEIILAVMEDAEKKQMSEAIVRLWMKDLKAIAYDAEDILDEYYYEVILWKREKEERDNSTFFNKVCNLCSSSISSFVCSWNLAHQIKEINERFKIIANRKNDFGLQNIGSSSSSSHELMMKNRETCSLVRMDWKIVGREDDKSKIINTSLDKNSCLVIPIVGLGGMGKTTLVQQVYNDPDVKRHFDIKVWVCVSDPFDIKKLFKTIASSLGVARQYDEVATMDDIACRLQDALRGKKFLLVLDDVWNENFEDWLKLKTPLMFGAEGSKIIVTTRSVKVAELMKDKFPHYELGILNDNDSWSLFKEITFGSAAGAVETPKLVEIGKEMVKRCGGLPLALIFLGSLMRSKRKEEEWKIIRDTKVWHESRDGKNSKILPSLRLSYDYLPSHLKLCFSYCCLFPKDFEIYKDGLIQLWMAEGFLIETPGETTMSMEEIGNEYFHSLLSSLFFQDVKKDNDGDIRTCKMHDLVHDLARSVMRNHECLIVENALDIDYISEETRRLNLSVYLDDEEMLPKVIKAMKKAKNLRTVFVNEQRIRFDIGNAFKENKRLRVLHLNGFSVTTESTSSSIGGLKHLRYLLAGEILFPKGIDRLRFLQTLSEFKVGEKKDGKHTNVIEELEGLNLLRLLCIANLESVTSWTDACRANLKEKKNLRVLYLCWNEKGRYENNNDETLLEGLRPHPNLRYLGIVGFEGARLPRWIEDASCLPNLVELTLRGGIYEQVAGFGALPSLKSLTLYGLTKLELYNSAAGETFPSLKKLTLKFMFSLVQWAVPPPPPPSTSGTNYCFPLLEEINILSCDRLTITPTIFPSLKVLYLEGGIDGMAAKPLVTNNLNSLTSVRLDHISNLISLPVQGLMENNNTLLSLSIECCYGFEGFFPPNKGGGGGGGGGSGGRDGGGQQLQEEGSQEVSSSSSSSLQSLKLYNCPAMRIFPDIHSLSSLRKLEIRGCKISKSLQDELTCLSSSSLKHLEHVFLKFKTATTETEEEEVVFEWGKPSSFEKDLADTNISLDYHWSLPPAGYVKINVDGACAHGKSAAGAIVRNHQGHFVGCASKALDLQTSSIQAEAEAFLLGLLLIEELNLSNVIIEGDAKFIVDCINDNSHDQPWRIGNTIQRCKNFLHQRSDATISFAPRTTNTVAHALAKFSLNYDVTNVWSGGLPPPPILDPLFADLACIVTPIHQ